MLNKNSPGFIKERFFKIQIKKRNNNLENNRQDLEYI